MNRFSTPPGAAPSGAPLARVAGALLVAGAILADVGKLLRDVRAAAAQAHDADDGGAEDALRVRAEEGLAGVPLTAHRLHPTSRG